MRALVLVAAVWALAALGQDAEPSANVGGAGTAGGPVTPVPTSAPTMAQAQTTAGDNAAAVATQPDVAATSNAQAANAQPGSANANAAGAGPEVHFGEPGIGGTEISAQNDEVPAAPQAEVRAMQQKMDEQTRALQEANARIEQLEAQLKTTTEATQKIDQSIEPRSVAANKNVTESQRRQRIAQLERALAALEEVQERISAGDDAPDALTAAATELENAANNATFATPSESDHLVQAQQNLSSVAYLMSTRNTHVASVAVYNAQMHAAQALGIARQQQSVTK